MTSQQLQLALAKMLPEKIHYSDGYKWKNDYGTPLTVEVTSREWLHVCWLVEQTLTTTEQQNNYQSEIADICWGDESRANNQVVFNQLTASWQTRAEALCRVKGITPL